MLHFRAVLSVSERQACRVVGQCRATQQYVPIHADDEESLCTRIVALAHAYGRYGYRRITALLHQEGWRVNHKRVERIWRQEGLKVPQKQPKRARRWFADGSCIRRRAEYPNHVWSYDFVMERTQDGWPLTMLTVVDEFTRECLWVLADQLLTGEKVAQALEPVVHQCGAPRSITVDDNGSECASRVMKAWAYRQGTQLDCIRPGKPVENGFIEHVNGRLRDECLNVEGCFTVEDVREKSARWWGDYNRLRPHSSVQDETSVALTADLARTRPSVPPSPELLETLT